jgi:hypothetical protein
MVNTWLPRRRSGPENRTGTRLPGDRSNFRQMPMFQVLRKFAAHFRQILCGHTTTPSAASGSFVSKADEKPPGTNG